MEISNAEQIGRLLAELNENLRPFVERALEQRFGTSLANQAPSSHDVAATLQTMNDHWGDVFQKSAGMGQLERARVNELLEWRNKWAHGASFSEDDVAYVEYSVESLSAAVSRCALAGGERLGAVRPQNHARSTGPHQAELPASPSVRLPPSAVGGGYGAVWYHCLGCGGKSPTPREPLCRFELRDLRSQGHRCGFVTRRWEIVNNEQAASLRLTSDIHRDHRWRDFWGSGGGYVLGCVAALFGILAIIFVIEPRLVSIYDAIMKIIQASY